MKVLHTIASLNMSSGGPTLTTYLTVSGLNRIGIKTDILTYDAPANDVLIAKDHFIKLCSALEGKHIRFAYSKNYKSKLEQMYDFDIYHAQGLWQYPTYATAKLAKKLNKPYLITLRGMLYPQVFEKSGLIKKIALKLYQKRDIQNASCIHATCMEEMTHLRNLGIKTPVAVIPNPIETEIHLNKPILSHTIKRIGYLGRLHPRKRVERLIYAFEKLGNTVSNCELVIIGDGDKEYLSFLKEEVFRLKLNNVIFTGFLTGIEKENAINSLSFLAVPSDFENFGNIITEALVRGIPVIASTGAPWENLNIYKCGWWVKNDINTLANTILEAIRLSENQRIEMGINGKELIKSNYSVEIVSCKMKQLYEWILNKKNKPDFVYLK